MNKLIDERSAFLRAHASEPVNWLPWGDDAFKAAAFEKKPMFIHIGFFGSHTCSRMSRESFCSPAIARLLNTCYIPVLVDREEHPGVEALYSYACTLINGSAGSPLNVFTDTNGTPFLACSYVPAENTGNVPGLATLLPALSGRWKTDRKTLTDICSELQSRLDAPVPADGTAPDANLLKAAAEQLAASHDGEYGGFGKGAKFPAPQLLLFLQRYSKLSGDKKSREILSHTLQQMYRGGFYDHLGGGFFRFAVDREWLRPHFEKPLRENALLAYVYTEAWQDGRLELYRSIAESCLDFALRELKSEQGGFYTCLDSECGGKEGAYYLLTCEEVNTVLGDIDGKHFSECYDITPEGNCSGRNIPNLLLNNRWNLIPSGYDDFREKLRLYREQRFTPAIDTLQTLSANSLMLMAIAKAAAVFDDKRYLAESKALADFITGVFISDGENRRCYCGGASYGDAGLADLALAGLGMLELYAACREPEYLLLAKDLADSILADFTNDESCDDWLDDGLLPARRSSVHDTESPSGAGAAAVLLRRLAGLCGNGEYRTAADEQAAYLASRAGSFPAGCAFGLLAVLDTVYSTRTLICVAPDDREPEALALLRGRYTPDTLTILKTPANAEILADASPMTAECITPGLYLSLGGEKPTSV